MSKHLSLAYQLYSAREDVANDMEGTLTRLSRMGYEGVEFAGFFGHSAKEVRKLCKKVGLKPVSSHVSLEQIRGDMHGVLDYHLTLGCEYIAVPYLSESDRPGGACFAQTLQTLYVFGRLCKKHGITLLYHNHDFEFATVSGLSGLDFMLEALPDSLLKAQPDTCWLKAAGRDPAEFIRRYAHRCPLIHLQDYMAPPDAPILFKPVGCGCQDVPGIIAAASESRTRWIVVEQDDSVEHPALEDAQTSAENVLSFL